MNAFATIRIPFQMKNFRITMNYQKTWKMHQCMQIYSGKQDRNWFVGQLTQNILSSFFILNESTILDAVISQVPLFYLNDHWLGKIGQTIFENPPSGISRLAFFRALELVTLGTHKLNLRHSCLKFFLKRGKPWVKMTKSTFNMQKKFERVLVNFFSLNIFFAWGGRKVRWQCVPPH